MRIQLPGPRFSLVRGAVVAVGLSGLLALGACGGSSPSSGSATTPGGAAATSAPATAAPVAGADVTIPMIDDAKTVGAFQPAKIAVKAGQTVGWSNVSGQPHNVIFLDKSVVSSDLLQKGQTFKATFPKAGTYKYSCTLHPGMDGEIDVT